MDEDERMRELSQQLAWKETGLFTGRESTECNEPFTSLVFRQSRFVFRVAYAVVRNVQDAEDITQETFLKIYRAGAWRQMKDERAFLARTAWRIAIERKVVKAEQTPTAEPVSMEQSPEQAALAADWNATVHKMMDALPDELREPLVLSAIDEMRSHEIGEILGIPEGTVRTRLMRARQILKQKLSVLMENSRGK